MKPRSILLILMLIVFVIINIGKDVKATGNGGSPITTTVVSVNDLGAPGNENSSSPSISADGRYVAFSSDAGNLIVGQYTPGIHIYVHDRLAREISIISISTDGARGNDRSTYPSISGNGRYVAFESRADNLVVDDTNNVYDIFVHDRDTGQTTRISVSTNGVEGNDASRNASISFDGRYVAFSSKATNLVSGDTNGVKDVFVHDRDTGITERISVSSNGEQGDGYSSAPSISSNGHYVVFISSADNFHSDPLPYGSENVFVRNRNSGMTTIASVGSFEGETTYGAENLNSAFTPAISDDGRYVAFNSREHLTDFDTNTNSDIYVHDMVTGQNIMVTQGSNYGSGESVKITPSGQYVVFHSTASNLVPGDNNIAADIFVYDRVTTQINRASIAWDGAEANRNSNFIFDISDDGLHVTFSSQSDNLTELSGSGGIGESDIFVRGPEFLSSLDHSIFLPVILD